MEDPVLPNCTVQIIVNGVTKTIVFPLTSSTDVEFVEKRMRSTFNVTGGTLSSSSQQPVVVVYTLVAGGAYYFLEFSTQDQTQEIVAAVAAAVAPALTAEAIAEAVVAKQEEIEMSKREKAVAISRATRTKTTAVLSRLELARTVDDDPVPLTSCSPFPPFPWNGRDDDDDDAMKDARNHIETQLEKFGVQIGRGGYKVNDVHSDKALLNFCDPKVGDFHGGTDVVVVPYKTANGGFSTECCVLFELKTDENVRKHENGLRHFENQALLELLSARCLSRQPSILVVLTDLVSGAMLYTIEYRVEYDSFEVVEKETTLDEMGILVGTFLASKAVPDAGFRPREEENNIRDKCCIEFKKRKLSHDVGLAWEQFEEMAEDTAPNSRERAELVAQLFRAMEVPQIPSFVHHCLYN